MNANKWIIWYEYAYNLLLALFCKSFFDWFYFIFFNKNYFSFFSDYCINYSCLILKFLFCLCVIRDFFHQCSCDWKFIRYINHVRISSINVQFFFYLVRRVSFVIPFAFWIWSWYYYWMHLTHILPFLIHFHFIHFDFFWIFFRMFLSVCVFSVYIPISHFVYDLVYLTSTLLFFIVIIISIINLKYFVSFFKSWFSFHFPVDLLYACKFRISTIRRLVFLLLVFSLSLLWSVYALNMIINFNFYLFKLFMSLKSEICFLFFSLFFSSWFSHSFYFVSTCSSIDSCLVSLSFSVSFAFLVFC